MSTNYFKATLVGAFIASSLVQLAACQSNDAGKGKGTPVKVRSASDKAGLQGKSSTDLSKDALLGGSDAARTPEQKDAAFTSLNMELLNQGHQFFSEAWKIASKNRDAKIESVFSQTLKRIQTSAAAAKSADRGHNCTGEDVTEVVVINRAKDSVPNQLVLDVQDCNKKSVGWVVQLSLVTKNQIRMYFNATRLVEGAGERAATMIKDKNHDLLCMTGFDDNKQIKTMSCSNLGQTLAKGKHLAFDSFEYDRSAKTILSLKTTTYGEDLVTVDPSSCSQSIQVPASEGKIVVVVPAKCMKDSTQPEDTSIDKNSPLFKPAPLGASDIQAAPVSADKSPVEPVPSIAPATSDKTEAVVAPAPSLAPAAAVKNDGPALTEECFSCK